MAMSESANATRVRVAKWSELTDRKPEYALVSNVDLVVVRYDDEVSVLYGRCLHRGVLLADGSIQGDNLVCGVHGWDYRFDTGVSSYSNEETLHKFQSWIDSENDSVYVDAAEVAAWEEEHAQPYQRDAYLGLYADVHGTPEESENAYIQELARNGLKNLGHHGKVSAMGVAIPELPQWKDIQVLTGQLSRRPLLEDVDVGTELVVGPRAKRPLRLEIPLFVSDMSFGALSEEAKTALAKGAEHAGTESARARAACCPRNRLPTRDTSMNLHRRALAGESTRSSVVRLFISKLGKVPRRVPAATFRVERSVQRSRRSEG